jgi:hypothetical protein
MKKFIHYFYVRDIRNNLHYEFFSSVLKVLQTNDASAASIVASVSRLEELLAEEDDALDIVRRYEATEAIQENDRGRDVAFNGIHKIVRVQLHHFDPDKRAAAQRLEVVFKDFSGTPHLPLPEESTAIQNFLQRFDSLADDVLALGLKEWGDKLREHNDNVRRLTEQRETEAAARAHIRTKSIRAEVDQTYDEIVARLEAAATLEGPEAYAALFDEINARIDEYKKTVSRERRQREKPDTSGSETPPVAD